MKVLDLVQICPPLISACELQLCLLGPRGQSLQHSISSNVPGQLPHRRLSSLDSGHLLPQTSAFTPEGFFLLCTETCSDPFLFLTIINCLLFCTFTSSSVPGSQQTPTPTSETAPQVCELGVRDPRTRCGHTARAARHDPSSMGAF